MVTERECKGSRRSECAVRADDNRGDGVIITVFPAGRAMASVEPGLTVRREGGAAPGANWERSDRCKLLETLCTCTPSHDNVSDRL